MFKCSYFIYLPVIVSFSFAIAQGEIVTSLNSSLHSINSRKVITFTDISKSAGVYLVTPQTSAIWGDYNRDGYEDLFVVNHFNSPNLYRNNRDGTFTDIQPNKIGIKSGLGDWHGAAWGDYNNDKYLDIYVLTGKAIIKGSDFYINNKNGKFIESAVKARITNDDGRGRIVQWVDINRDGLLDIFVANHKNELASNAVYINNGNGTFDDKSDTLKLKIDYGSRGVLWADYDNDGDSDLCWYILIKNLGTRYYAMITIYLLM